MKIFKANSKQPIPKSAKRVFKGIMFDVYQWQQKMFDGTFQTFEKIKREDTAMVIPVTTDGKIILLKESQPGKKPFTALVGGRIGRNEKVLDAAKRELLEETGYEAREFIMFDSFQPVSKIEWNVYTFIAKDCKKVSEINPDSGEKIKLMPVSFEEFLKIVMSKEFNDTELTLKLLRDGYTEIGWNKNKINTLRNLLTN